jgi:hypothetical protein
MATNSFVKRNFIAANGKAQARTQGAFLYFLLSLGEGPVKDLFFHFSLVPTMFLMGSHQVPNMFSKFQMCSPTCSP